jgi:pyrimidine and pyridine-specific 5'-nucleotidase
VPKHFQIFTNADKAHAAEVLKRMGFEDCFEGVICFETLNPPLEIANNMDALDNDAMIAGGEPEPSGFDGTIATGNKNKIKNDLDNGISSKSRILCKPSLEAIEAAIQIANVDPRKTVIFDS